MVMIENRGNKLETFKIIVKEQRRRLDEKLDDLGVIREKLADLKLLCAAPQPVIVTGLRRAGKSTLLLQLLKTLPMPDWYYLNFEDERFGDLALSDLDLLHQALVEIFGVKKTFIIDEIQVVPGWERWVRRLSDQGYKLLITGSNASMLSRELGTKLTGRYQALEVFPFSFLEYLDLKAVPGLPAQAAGAEQLGILNRSFSDYLAKGGIPDALRYPQLDFHRTLFNDILYRDIVVRHRVENVKALRDLALYLMGNVAALFSFNKLKALLGLKSGNTVKSFVDYLEESWLFFTVPIYHASLKAQQINPKKAYCVDTGMAATLGFSASDRTALLFENLVFLYLRRFDGDIFYYRTRSGAEVDFYLPDRRLFVQSCYNLENSATIKRETKALEEALSEIDSAGALILTRAQTQELALGGRKVGVRPLVDVMRGQAEGISERF